ncbi:spermidine synthase [Devosia sp. CN2-171]|uniref:spermidine synthase n=1 Tax=Devosia sp. CN2-171 TaxID=3400909 RepID=UPI003BF8F16D
MLPWVELGRAKVPGGGEFRLMQRGTEFTIFAGTIGLMSSRQAGSEEAMSNIAAVRIGGKPKARVLIGGLGMGFTLRAALAQFRPDAEIVVAELVPEIAGAWARGPLAHIHGEGLDDPRLTVRVGDVGDVMTSDTQKFDAILLDVDNGPEGLSRPGNDALYSHGGIAKAKSALRPGGMLAVWSVAPDPHFAKRLGQSGLKVEELKARAHGGKGARHVIWVATKA